jgi:hypothetical protein
MKNCKTAAKTKTNKKKLPLFYITAKIGVE